MSKKKKHSGPSGKNRSGVARVPGTDDEREAWSNSATLTHQPFAAWARDAMNARAKAQGFEPQEKLNDGKTDH